MIQEFSVENHLSFGEKQILSLEATSDKHYHDELTVEVKDGVRLLKMIMIYGANASGKTNLLSAINAVWRLLLTPSSTKGSPIRLYTPFALSNGQPTRFSIIFYIDGIKYSYEISYNLTTILSEKMIYYPENRPANFYTREMTNDIQFGDTLNLSKETKYDLTRYTFENHSVLSTFAKIDIQEKDTIIEKLYNRIRDTYHDDTEPYQLLDLVEETQSDTTLKQFIKDSFTVSDINILDFTIIEKMNDIPDALKEKVLNDNSLPEGLKNVILAPTVKRVEFTHITDHGTFTLDQKYESHGTISSLPFYRKFYDLVNRDCILTMDEIGRDLHSDLLKHCLIRFIRNSKNSQLIFTTHDQTVLDEDYVRRDMVWFAEKSNQTAMTELFSAACFGLHKNVSIFNSYKIGKLGAKPYLGSTLITL